MARQPDPRDRRSKRVVLTPASLALAAEMEGQVEALRAELLVGYEPAALEAAIAVLEGVYDRAAASLAGDAPVDASKGDV